MDIITNHRICCSRIMDPDTAIGHRPLPAVTLASRHCRSPGSSVMPIVPVTTNDTENAQILVSHLRPCWCPRVTLILGPLWIWWACAATSELPVLPPDWFPKFRKDGPTSPHSHIPHLVLRRQVNRPKVLRAWKLILPPLLPCPSPLTHYLLWQVSVLSQGHKSGKASLDPCLGQCMIDSGLCPSPNLGSTLDLILMSEIQVSHPWGLRATE